MTKTYSTREIYLCCNGKDIPYEKKLRDGLKPILSRFNLALWSRHDLTAGTLWKHEMKNHLAMADLFVVLASPDCLADDMCNIEIQAAQYRAQHEGLKIISIRIRPCMFEFSDLAQYAYLPKNGRTIAESKNADEAWTGIQRDLLEMISRSHQFLG
jgi:hypothetical protein